MGTRSLRSKSCNKISGHRWRTTAQCSMAKNVCLDSQGRSRFNDLLFRRGPPCFFAFDLLFVNGQDLRVAQLSDRKHELRRLLARVPADSRVGYADHIETFATRLFELVCALDLEGIVAKQKCVLHRPARNQYVVQDSQSPLLTDGRAREVVRA